MNKAIMAIIAFGLVSTFIIFVFLPTFGGAIEEMSVPVQFVFFNFIVFALISAAMLVIFKNHYTSLKVAVFGTLIVLAIDLNLPDYAVNSQGVVATATALGFFGSSDYAFAAFYQMLGIHGPFLAFCVYPLTSVLLLVMAFLVLGGKTFVKLLKRMTSF